MPSAAWTSTPATTVTMAEVLTSFVMPMISNGGRKR